MERVRVRLSVAYGYLELGSLDAFAARGYSSPSGFISVTDELVTVATGTHTGVVDLEVSIGEDVERREEFPGQRDEVELPIDDHNIHVGTFHGLDETFHLLLPEDWMVARVRAFSERFDEAQSSGGHTLTPPELVRIDFSSARRQDCGR